MKKALCMWVEDKTQKGSYEVRRVASVAVVYLTLCYQRSTVEGCGDWKITGQEVCRCFSYMNQCYKSFTVRMKFAFCKFHCTVRCIRLSCQYGISYAIFVCKHIYRYCQVISV